MAIDDALQAPAGAGAAPPDIHLRSRVQRTPTPSFLDAESLARLRTTPGASSGFVRLGFVFGPRALARCLVRPVDVIRTQAVGVSHTGKAVFADAGSIARFCVRELNASLRRARVAARVSVGAVSCLAGDETRPLGPYPGARLLDVLEGRVVDGGRALPLECWARASGVNAVFVLVDWRMYRSRIQRGDWAGFAPAPAAIVDGETVFHPVGVADIGCALSALTLAHEFGHLLGCGHESEPTRIAPYASAYAPAGSRRFGIMAAARRDERGRRLEWSRPLASGAAWMFGDTDHDEARWLRTALPQLARQRFACHGACGGACAT